MINQGFIHMDPNGSISGHLVPICSNDKCPFGVYLVYIFGSKYDTTFMIVMI
jgi:hypothetical protein